jgi:hypothetical protein
MGDNAKWQHIPLPKGLVERLDEFVASPDARRMGHTSKASFLAWLLRDFLDKWDAEKNSK